MSDTDSDKNSNMQLIRGQGRFKDEKGNRQCTQRDGPEKNTCRDLIPQRKHSRYVLLKNIPYECKWPALKNLFNKVGEVIFVKVLLDENMKSLGCAIVKFSNPEHAKEAIEKMNRYEFKGRQLVVKEVNADKKKVRRDNCCSGGEESYCRADTSLLANEPPTGDTNTYNLSSQFLKSLGIRGPLSTRCFVSNLDSKVDKRKLKEIFRLAGRVVSTEIYLAKGDKSKCNGVVEFIHPVEAVQAISMLNNQKLYGRQLRVRMGRIYNGIPKNLPEGLEGIGMGLGTNGAPLQVSCGCGLGESSSNIGGQYIDIPGSALSSSASLSGHTTSPITQNSYSINLDDTDAPVSLEPTETIHIKNLPPGTTSQILREKFQAIGDVMLAEMRSKDTAVVKFNNQRNALRAICMMDGVTFNNHILQISYLP